MTEGRERPGTVRAWGFDPIFPGTRGTSGCRG